MSVISEQEVLKTLAISSFHEMTKDRLPAFASMISSMDPEVAKKAIEQIPEFTKMASSALTDYKGTVEKALQDNSASSKPGYELYNKVIDALNECLSKEDISFEEKKYYIEQIKEITQMADRKDLQNKEFIVKSLVTMACLAMIVGGIGRLMLGGGSSST